MENLVPFFFIIGSGILLGTLSLMMNLQYIPSGINDRGEQAQIVTSRTLTAIVASFLGLVLSLFFYLGFIA